MSSRAYRGQCDQGTRHQRCSMIDGASDLFVEAFAPESKQHARSADGMFELPRCGPAEIEAV